MKKKDIIEGVVTGSVYPGTGTMEVEGKTVEVKRTIPGQTIRCRIKKFKNGKAQANLLEILERSPEEIEPDCPHFGACGGCVYRNLTIEKQRELKEQQMLSLLGDYLTPGVWEGLHASPDTNEYRNKMEFSFGDVEKGGDLALGMHKISGHYDIVTVDKCRIVDEDYRKILRATLDFFAERNVPFYHSMNHVGYLRHLLVREGRYTGQLLIDLVTSTQTELLSGKEGDTTETAREVEEKMLQAWKERILSLDLEREVVSILHTHNDSLADIVKDEGTAVLYGQKEFVERLFDLSFCITPFSFFQTNTRGAETLYQIVRDYVGNIEGSNVYDLYCGTGTITQVLAKTADHVTGVEIVEEAVDAAVENAKRNGLSNCRFIAGDVLKVIDELDGEASVIVLDPPRDGVHPKALPKILHFQPERIVYVSCKPTSLVRDLAVITQAGYRLERACCADIFPGSGHIETVVTLSRS